MTASRQARVRAAFVGGPMYDALYDRLPRFEKESGYTVEIVQRLPHPELNAYVKSTFESGAADLDLISTHTKYAPSQAQWLAPLDELLPADTVGDVLSRPLELSRIDGRLLQVPRNLDVRLLHYRRDLFDDPGEQARYAERFHRQLSVPDTWEALIDVATFFTRPADMNPKDTNTKDTKKFLGEGNEGGGTTLFGFLFPGRDSGLFGTFYELLVGAGGRLFDPSLRPAFDSAAGAWAVSVLADLYGPRRVTPRDLPAWHYDEISAAFRDGRAALVADWPGSHHLYRSPETCRVAGHVGLAPLPAGPAGIRAAYAGCHSFAIARTAENPGGALALLQFLTSFDAQLGEARHGAIPCRASALARVREEAAADPIEARRWSLLADTERTMIIPPRFAAYPQCEDAIWQSVQQGMVGQCTPARAVQRAAREVQTIVEARGSLVR
jgi:multiple sugar transport system substrate-binding protein